MTHWGVRTRPMGTFPVNRENISPAENAGLPESSGPLGLAPTYIVRLRVSVQPDFTMSSSALNIPLAI